MRTRNGRDAGGALVISVFVIFILAAFMAAFLNVPTLELRRAGMVVAQQKARLAADAGLRDAISWRTANKTTALPFPTGTFGSLSRTTFGEGDFKWQMTDATNGYLKITIEGRAKAPVGGNSSNALFVEAPVEAIIKEDVPLVNMPAAASWMYDPAAVNTTTNPSPPSLYTTQNGGSPPSINGTDAASSSNVASVAFQDTTMTFGAGSSQVVDPTGPPPAIASGVGPAPAATPQATWSALSQLVTLAQQTPANPPSFQKYVYSTGFAGVPTFTNSMIYVQIPDGAVVSDTLMTINGNNPDSGIIIFDIGDNVTFQTSPVYQKNGTSYFQGAMILYQRGRLNTAAGGIELVHKNGNNANFLQFNSASVASALQNLSSGYKLVSKRVLATALH